MRPSSLHWAWLGVMEDIRTAQVDIRPSEMDFHINMVCRRGCIYIQDRLIVRGVDEPADTVCGCRVGRSDQPLHVGRAHDGREIDMI